MKSQNSKTGGVKNTGIDCVTHIARGDVKVSQACETGLWGVTYPGAHLMQE